MSLMKEKRSRIHVMRTNVSAVYLHVVDAVVSKLREEFNEKFEDYALTELKWLWELKMIQCGVLQGLVEENSASRGSAVPTPVCNLNAPYEGTEEYKTETAEIVFASTPLWTFIQTPLPVEPGGDQYIPGGHAEYGMDSDSGPAVYMKTGRPAPYMQSPFPWMNQRPLGGDCNVAYEEAKEEDKGRGMSHPQPPMKDFLMMTSRKRKREEYPPYFLPNEHIPQQDEAGNVFFRFFPRNDSPYVVDSQTLHDRLKIQERWNADAIIAPIIKMEQDSASIPWYPGYDEGICTKDYNTPSYLVGTPKLIKTEALEGDEPPLNEDDDDDDDGYDQVQGDEETTRDHLVLTQFDKVSKTKGRWKCTLRNGMMRLNNKDILFAKAKGEFDF